MVTLFRVAAGPRVGYGHLRRATVLARAVGGPSRLSLRGGAVVPPAAGWDVTSALPTVALRDVRPDLLVVDDPSTRQALPWVRAAARAGVPCASLHDVGLAPLPSDLAVDGGLCPGRHRLAGAVLSGPEFVVVDLPHPRPRPRAVVPRVSRIVVSLGGGGQRGLARALVTALGRVLPGAHIVVTAGLDVAARLEADVAGAEVVAAPDGAARWLATADVAVVAGGLTLYEAVALGVPTVAIPVVPAQRPTVRAVAARGLAVAVAGEGDDTQRARRIARGVAALAADLARRRAMRSRGPACVDGQGARRIARAFRALVRGGRVDGGVRAVLEPEGDQRAS